MFHDFYLAIWEKSGYNKLIFSLFSDKPLPNVTLDAGSIKNV